MVFPRLLALYALLSQLRTVAGYAPLPPRLSVSLARSRSATSTELGPIRSKYFVEKLIEDEISRETDKRKVEKTLNGQQPEIVEGLDSGLSEEEDDHDHDHDDDIEVEIHEVFQELIQTRRTSGKFVPLQEFPPEYESGKDYWINVMDRAVECAVQAPNHRMTEPFTFTRMISPSDAVDRLAEIAYQVQLRKLIKAITTNKREMEDYSPDDEMEERAEAFKNAQSKRNKWASIPAYLVVTVKQDNMFVDINAANTDFDALPFSPIRNELALEDYASACAAVQNTLLSLHSENVATKWATGPVIDTPAFRKLVRLQPNDRVVALIMIGAHPHPDAEPRLRKNRRAIQGNVLLDL